MPTPHTEDKVKYEMFTEMLSRYCSSGLGRHFIRRWKPYQRPIDDDVTVKVFDFFGVRFDPSHPKWYQFWKKKSEQKFIEAISKIKIK